MKIERYLFGIFTVIMAAVISVSCSREKIFIPNIPEEKENAPGLYRLTIAAGQDNTGEEDAATRAFLDTSTGLYYWTSGDRVGLTIVPTTTPNTPFVYNLPLNADCTASTLHTTFTGTFNITNATVMTGNKYDYYSYFPYNSTLANTFPSVQFQIPATMVVQPNVFDPNLAPMVSDRKLNEDPIIYLDGNQASGNFLHFDYKHILSYAAIEMDCSLMSQKITSITITSSNSSRQLWGTYSYNMTSGTGGYTGGSNSITISITGGLTVGGGNILYIPMPPVNMSGETFTFKFNTATTSPCKYIDKTIQGVSFQRGVIHHLRIAPRAEYDGSTNFTTTIAGYYYIEAWGGNGGSGAANSVVGGTGGTSQKIQGLYYLNAGEVLNLYVGSAGESTTALGNSGAAPAGGANGSSYGNGGNGGQGGNKSGGTSGQTDGGKGGAGGAGTFILKNGTSIPSNLLLVSGGGGGGGGAANSASTNRGGNGGNGSGTAGSNGSNGSKGADNRNQDGNPGQGNGTGGSGGGTGSAGGNSSNYNGGSGGAGQNGQVSSLINYSGGAGGGGAGGGYSTGGGGGQGGGRAGQGTLNLDAAGGGGGGAGGASYLTGTIANPGGISLPNNSRTGTNGYVVITFFRP